MRCTPVRLLAFPLVAVALASAGRAQGLPPAPVPPANPITPAKTLLGKALFWDEQLSASRTVACGTCHVFSAGGSDPRSSLANPASTHPGPDGVFATPDDVTGSPGVVHGFADGHYLFDPSFALAPQVTPRKSPTVVNSAFAQLLFWDGRASGQFLDPLAGTVVLQNGALENQAVAPPTSEVEMGAVGFGWSEIATRIAASTPLRLAPSLSPDLASWIAGRTYPDLFGEAFGTPAVTPARVALAIATYERTLVSNQAPLDAFLAGVPGALTQLEQQGRALFNSPQASCNVCHAGPRLSNDSFHYTGVRPQNEDLGRFLVTGNPADRGRMRTPTLRNIELHAPYFHTGRAATLEDVVEFYDRGGDFDAPNKPTALIRPLGLTAQQKAALVAFLRRPLTDPRVANETAPFDRPALASESGLSPRPFGSGTPGSGGFEPRMIALSPPAIGNPALVLAVDRGLGGARAMLVTGPRSDPAGTPFQGAALHVAFVPGAQIARVAALAGSGAGAGWTSVVVPAPVDPVLIGTSHFAQWLVFDPSAPQGFAASRAVGWTWF